MKVSNRNPAFAVIGVCVMTGLGMLWFGGQSGSDPVVGGFVFFDDLPLSNADVFFIPEESSGQSTSYIGTANGGGYYEVAGGVPAGDYRVLVRAAIGNTDDATPTPEGFSEIDGMQQLMMSEAKSQRDARPGRRRRRASQAMVSLPEIYSSAAYTILRVRVPEEGTETADMYLWSDLCEVIASEMPINRAIR